MSTQNSIWNRELPGHWIQWTIGVCLGLLIVLGLFFKFYEPDLPTTPEEQPTKQAVVTYPKPLDTAESIELRVHEMIAIGVRSRESFWELRKRRVEEHRELGIFPTPYEIDGPDQRPVYEGVDWSVDWLEPTQLFILNPYLLATASRTSSVTTVATRYPPHLLYAKGMLVERYFGDEGRQWLRWFRTRRRPDGNAVQIWFVNATDAGFHYAGLDTRECVNVSNVCPARPPNHLVNNVMRLTKLFYHHGRLGHNNLSPDDADARLLLVDIAQETKIVIRLWRNQPHDLTDDPDLFYVIHVKPY